MDQLDAFVDELQEKIFDEARQAYGEKGFRRWRNPRYNGRMGNPDGHACITGMCGDTMEIHLKFYNNIVINASYVTDGCASSAICGSFAAEIAMGKNPDELADLSEGDVLKAIGRLPKEDMHCAALAAEALQQALSDYMTRQARPSRSDK